MDEHYYSKLETLQMMMLCEADHLNMDEEFVCLMREAFISLIYVRNTRMWQAGNGAMFMCEGRDEWQPIVGADGVHSATEWRRINLPYYLKRFIAIQLADAQNIMICGELVSPDHRRPSAQTDRPFCCFLFNTQTFATTRCLNTPFEFAQAAGLVLGDGSVFVCGGVSTSPREMNEDRAAIFRDGRWHLLAARLRFRRRRHMCALMLDGRVLIFGGLDRVMMSVCEIFDPSTGQFSRACELPLTTWHGAAAITLPDGRVMACGGYHRNLKWRRGRMTFIYDPVEDTWTRMEQMKIERLSEHSLLMGEDENKVMVVGGANSPYPARYYPAEVFDLTLGVWSLVATHRVPKNLSVVKHVEHTHTPQRYNIFFHGYV